MKKAKAEGKDVVRLHTGDPAIYGAIKEQMDELEKLDINFEVVPGVSSFTAAAAAIKKEFTLPNVTQTVILTRIEGRTPVPETEDLAKLASVGASMAIFLSVSMIDKVVAKLREGYGRNVPIAVIEKATWPDERSIIGTLDDISEKVKVAGITKTAQILVGDFIDCEYDKSLLYDKSFSHMFRDAEK
jgi:precorrin-4/cobalt-precorrin-4 C11-methyltransferase